MAVVILVWAPLAAFIGWFLIIKPVLVLRRNPTRDALRIKRDFEGQGRVVTDIQRTGTDWGGRYTPTYRRYAVTVRRHDGETAEFIIGVAFGLASDADLSEHDPEKRKVFFRGSRRHF